MAGLMGRATTVVKVKFSKLLDNAEDPNETLDYSYEQQLTLLQNVRRRPAMRSPPDARISLARRSGARLRRRRSCAG